MTKKATRKWSPEQKKIFTWFETGTGNLVVRARAGTGKTTTILEGVERAPENRILLAAFNKSIATELQSKIKSERVSAKTLHGLGFSYVRKMWGAVEVDSNGKRSMDLALAVCEQDSPREAVLLVAKIHTKAREIQPHNTAPEDLLRLMVRFDLMPDEGLEMEDGITPQWLANRASKAIERAKERTPIIDFADMIFLPIVHRAILPWFDMVVVDEAQDMTEAQLELAIGACRKGGRIAVVGDDRQAIYGFRGADSGSLDRLKTALRAQELGLTTTYRCPKLVVAIAAQLVPDYKAAASAPEGIVERCDDDRLIVAAGPRDFVLSRTNAPLVKVCMALLRAGKKAAIKGRDIGKGIAKLVDKQNAKTIDELLTKLDSWHARESARAIKQLSEDAAKERLDFICDQHEIIKAFCEDVESIADLRAKLETMFTDTDNSAIMCSTTHRAKGLESENVYLLENTFKKRRSSNGSGNGEEGNILYVAVTRAKQRLVWVADRNE